MQKLRIEAIVRRAGAKLAEALWFYWPEAKEHELNEANTRNYVAQAFAEAGWYTFCEVPLGEDQPAKKLDLVALDPTQELCVLCELKRDTELAKLPEDIQKIDGFVLPQKNLHDELRSASWTFYGLVGGTTWRDSYLSSWTLDSPEEETRWIPAVDEAIRQVSDSEPTWGSVVLQDWSYQDAEASEKDKWQYFVFAVFQLRNAKVR